MVALVWSPPLRIPRCSASPAPSQTISANHGNYRARTISVAGAAVVLAGYPDPNGSIGASDKLAVYDVTNASAPVLRRSSSATQGAIRDVVIQNGWAYVVADRFSTLNIVDPNATPNYSADQCGQENAVVVSGGYAFTAETGCAHNGTIYVYDVTNPAAPRSLGGQAVATGIGSHDFSDLELLGSDYLIGISPSASGRDVVIIDRRDVNALKKVGELQIAGIDSFRAKVVGSTLYVAGGDGGVAIVSVAQATALQLLSVFNTPGVARGVDVVGTTLAVSDGNGVSFYDTADPANPRLIGQQPTGGVAWDGAFGGKNLYVANDQGLVVVENVTAPPRIDTSRISIASSSTTTAVVSGNAAAITGDVPVRIDVRDVATSATIGVTANSDGSFSVTLPASAGDAITITATDGVGRVSGPVGVGSVPFGTAAKTTPTIIANDGNYRARTISVDGAAVVLAGYPDPNGSIGASDKMAVYDVTNASAHVLRRSSSATQGAIRDVVIQNGWAYG